MNPIIQVEHLKKSFPKVDVLKDVNFSVEKGEVFALLGSNGAGKSTIVKILSTLLRADAGKVTVGNYDLKKQPSKVRSMISLTGQYAAVDELLSARENMNMISTLFHVPKKESRVEELLTKLHLTDFADRKVSEFSGGMKRRLDIAMSLLGSPDIIFLDEPTTGLDPQSRLELWSVVRQLSDDGVTIFLTTQYLEEAEQLADRIAVLHEGTIIADGTVDVLKNMMPHGKVQLGFADAVALRAAKELLNSYKPEVEEDSMALSILTNDDVEMMTKILYALQEQRIAVSFLKQHETSLEEVFLTLIGETKGAKHNA